MTKVTYPELGLLKSQEKNSTLAENKIKTLSTVTFDIPDEISDSVLEGFPGIVAEFKSDLKGIKENYQKTDNNYKKLNSKINEDFSSFEEITISERTPIV